VIVKRHPELGQFTVSPDSDIALVATRTEAASLVSRAHRRSIWLNDARLDDGATRTAGQQALGPHARRSAAAEGAGARAAEAAAARDAPAFSAAANAWAMNGCLHSPNSSGQVITA